jgi:hypothetical protein
VTESRVVRRQRQVRHSDPSIGNAAATRVRVAGRRSGGGRQPGSAAAVRVDQAADTRVQTVGRPGWRTFFWAAVFGGALMRLEMYLTGRPSDWGIEVGAALVLGALLWLVACGAAAVRIHRLSTESTLPRRRTPHQSSLLASHRRSIDEPSHPDARK